MKNQSSLPRNARLQKNPDPAPSSPDVPALKRGILLLEWIAQRPAGATLSEVATDLDLPTPSALRLARVLEELGYLHRDERTKRYTLTSRMLMVGQPHSAQRSLVESAIDAMHQVLDATSETTQLCCLTSLECVVIDQLPSAHPFKYIVDLGSRISPHCCAPGKAMLAFLPELHRDKQLKKLHLTSYTERTHTTLASLQKDLYSIREKGFAVDHGEHFEGINCVAAPLLDRHGHAIAAITIAGPATRIPVSRFPELGKILSSAATLAANTFLA